MPKKSPYADLWIPQVSLSDYMFSCIQEYGNDVALVEKETGQTLTYSEVYSQSRKCASALFQHGLRKGDVVAICAPSCVEYAVIILATAACGGIVTTCNPAYTEGEMLQQLSISQPSMIFAHVEAEDMAKGVAAKLGHIKNIFVFGDTNTISSYDMLIKNGKEEDFPNSVSINVKEDPVLMPYSSGTTGVPKCVMHTHYSLVSTLILTSTGMHLFRSSCLYSERPMYHIGGVLMILGCLHSGAKLLIDKYSDVERIMNAIQDHKVTHTCFIPPVIVTLTQTQLLEKYDTSSLRYIMCGGASVSDDLFAKLQKKLNVPMIQGYGMTECSISINDPIMNIFSSVGVIVPNTRVKIIDLHTGNELGADEDGEILVDGPQRTIGYYKNLEATAQTIDEEGWLHTGDIGHYDKDGMMYLTGRLKEVIKYKTFQVPPAELESVLLKHPMIADVGVIGIPDPNAGELPRAFVVRKDESLSEDDVKKFIEEKLSEYKHLRGGVQFVDSIPKSVLGKILRQDLKKLLNCN